MRGLICLATILLYVAGFIAIAYLALYAYAFFTRPHLRPGDPIRIFRKQDAPSYSAIILVSPNIVLRA